MKWFKENWLIVAVIAAVALLAWQQTGSVSVYDKLMVSYNAQSASYKIQIDHLEKVNKEWREKQEALNVAHAKELVEIEERFQERLDSISKTQRVHRRRLVKAAEKDPQTLTRELNRIYGIPIYQPNK